MAEFNLETFLPYLVNVLASRLGNGLARVYAKRFDISIAEWRVIAHLSLNRNVSVREIHEAVDMDKAPPPGWRCSASSRSASTPATGGWWR